MAAAALIDHFQKKFHQQIFRKKEFFQKMQKHDYKSIKKMEFCLPN